MRLDYFLKLSRIVKRRPLAKEMCEKHCVQVNEQAAKAGKEVHAGDLIRVRFPHRTITVRVEQVPERSVSKHAASELYTLLEEIRHPENVW